MGDEFSACWSLVVTVRAGRRGPEGPGKMPTTGNWEWPKGRLMAPLWSRQACSRRLCSRSGPGRRWPSGRQRPGRSGKPDARRHPGGLVGIHSRRRLSVFDLLVGLQSWQRNIPQAWRIPRRARRRILGKAIELVTVVGGHARIGSHLCGLGLYLRRCFRKEVDCVRQRRGASGAFDEEQPADRFAFRNSFANSQAVVPGRVRRSFSLHGDVGRRIADEHGREYLACGRRLGERLVRQIPAPKAQQGRDNSEY